ncbi:MAG: FAD:protein FMN transferase [Clostridia bacterium]|nr:FAD:protein FMN transferase [Clostridia bacterium]MDD4048341.1 FAD:protein FMN transferase [Clostridia bacterium]
MRSQQVCEYQSEEFLMDTLVSISTYGTDTDLLKLATEEAFVEMRRIADLTDRFSEGDSLACNASDVSRINKMAGIEPVTVDKDVVNILKLAKEYTELTNGAFDITIGPVMDLWGFGQEKQKVPNSLEIQKVLELVDSKKIILNEDLCTAYLSQKSMSLDLGAVAKGYAVEKAVNILENQGIKSALIDAGGNIRVLGKKDNEKPWKVGIQDPRDTSSLVGILSLVDESAVTSGDYYRSIEINGRTYNHIISPKTGFPVGDNMSVTVITKDAFTADVLSTALFLMKSQQALALAEELEGIEAVLVNADQEILMTSGLIEKVVIK